MLESTRNEGLALPWMPPTEEPLPHYLKRGGADQCDSALPLTGLVRRAPKPGRWLIHTTLDMIRCLEVAESDIVDFETLTAEQSPFGRMGGTRVLVKKNAEIQTNWAEARLSDDEFDLDIRLGAGGVRKPHEICEGTEDGTTCAAECEGETDGCTDGCSDACHPPTANTCKTECGQATCDAQTCVTCHQVTCQGRNTCATCNQNTCAATCDQNTCNTCNTKCEQQTCATCNQATCDTCETKCRQPTCTCETCVACTHVTCGNQPACRL